MGLWLIALLLLATAILGSAPPRHWTDAEIEELCSNVEKAGIFRCKLSEEDELRQAREYIEKYGKPDAAKLSPVIILPGLGGSAMQAKLDKAKVPHWWCWSNWDSWFRLWLPIEEILAQDCWFDNLQLLYNPVTNEYSSPPGVTTDVINFGGLSGISYMDYWFGFPIPFTTYYAALISSLEALGYQEGVTLFGAPFDWRLPADKHKLDEAFFDRLHDLILKAYSNNGNTKVNVITHSLGGPTFLAFLNTKSELWINTYIEKFLPIAAPWSGSPKALRTVVSGDDFGVEILGEPLLNIKKVAQLAAQSGGIVQLIPYASYYAKNQNFLLHNGTNYTAADFSQLFIDADKPLTATIHQTVTKSLSQLGPPQVPTYCIYGNGIQTEQFYNYTGSFTDDPLITYSLNGDGTVPEESLRGCLLWENRQKQPIYTQQFNLVGHSDILEDPKVFEYIIQVLINNITETEK